MLKGRFFKVWTAIGIIATMVWAVEINEANFPDPNFRAALAELGITSENIVTRTSLWIPERSISDLTGIEHFSALTELYVQSNQLTELNVSGNTALIVLSVGGNQLTKLDVSKNTALWSLGVSSNQLIELDVSNNTRLAVLFVDWNQLTELDVSKNTALNRLYMGANQLTELDVSKNTALIVLEMFSNKLNKLDVSKNTALTSLNVAHNQLTEIDVSMLTNLESFYCSYNYILEWRLPARPNRIEVRDWMTLPQNALDSLRLLGIINDRDRMVSNLNEQIATLTTQRDNANKKKCGFGRRNRGIA